MNGTPEKHSFSSSEEERKTEKGEGGRESKTEGKDRVGGVDMHGEYIILLHWSTVTRCNVTQ